MYPNCARVCVMVNPKHHMSLLLGEPSQRRLEKVQLVVRVQNVQQLPIQMRIIQNK